MMKKIFFLTDYYDDHDTLHKVLQNNVINTILLSWLINLLLAYRLSRASHLVKEKGETSLQLAYHQKVNGYTALVKTGLFSYVLDA